MLLVFISCDSEKKAKEIAKKLLEKRLIGCANIIPNIKSTYRWKGKLEESRECLLICKTVNKKEKAIAQQVKKMHSYELPAIEFVKAKADKEFEHWIKKETIWKL